MADGGVTLDPNCVDPSRQGYIAVGGTSAGAPQWAAIVALANQVRMSQAKGPLGLVSPLLYDLAKDKRAYARDFNDVTTGSNALDLRAFGSPVPSAFGFDAGARLRPGDGPRHAERREPARRPRAGATRARSPATSSTARRATAVISATTGTRDHEHHRFDPSK